MTEQDFIALLHRFEKGLCTPEEQIRVEKWLDSMPEGKRPFGSDLEKKYLETALRTSIHEKAAIPRGKTRSLLPFTWTKVAATVLILVLGSYAFIERDFFVGEGKNIATVTRAENDIQKVLLSDGSIIWLKGESRLFYPETFSGKERVVRLEGEALFEVAKDREHPFIIHTGDLTTRVLGTSFNIKSTTDHTEVYVFTGRVSISLARTNQKIELLPQERVMYSHASNRLQKQDQSIEHVLPMEYTQGTDYNMYFQDTKVTDIASHIEKKFEVEVTLEGRIRSCVLTADFTDQSLNSTLDMISEALNARYKIEGDKVTLTGDGCE